jgi:hypothetical protein
MGWASLRPSISSGGNDDESLRDFPFCVCSLPRARKGKLPSLSNKLSHQYIYIYSI